MSINAFVNFIPLVNRIREEYLKFYSLLNQYFKEEIPQKQKILKNEITESQRKIIKLNDIINIKLIEIKNIYLIRQEIKKEKEKEVLINNKLKKFNELLLKAKNSLTKNSRYFNKLPEYANKKLKTASLDPIDLMNFTIRIGRQNKAPPNIPYYFKEEERKSKDYIPEWLEKIKQILNYFNANKNKLLYPFPKEQELKNTILKFNLSEDNRLLPPIVSPALSKVAKGTQLKFKYPEDKGGVGVFFKFSDDPNILPSYFSGEKYLENLPKALDKDCTIKVCSCKEGYKDSKIVTYNFEINNEENEKIIEKRLDQKERNGCIEKVPPTSIAEGEKFSEIEYNNNLSQEDSYIMSRQGTGNHIPNYIARNEDSNKVMSRQGTGNHKPNYMSGFEDSSGEFL